MSKINHQSIEQLDKLHLEFYNNFKTFKEMLEQKEETNFKYLRCRLDFNQYYFLKFMQDMGGMDDEDLDYGDYGNEDDLDYGNEAPMDEDEDIGVGGDDDEDDV